MYQDERLVFTKPKVMTDLPMHFCPGCHHGIIHRLVAECIDELALAEDCICVGSVGCSVFIYNYIAVDTVEAPHGRAPAVATGVKRARPDKVVFSYQGDGDLAAIGFSEIMYAANRGEKITVVFVNNSVYGMTGGQMAPTTMVGQKTTTSPLGRQAENDGFPIHMSELLSMLPGTAFVARVAVNTVKNIQQAKKGLKKAFQAQLSNKGMGFIEFLSACPTNWHLSPLEANKKVAEEMIACFPLGIFKDLADKE